MRRPTMDDVIAYRDICKLAQEHEDLSQWHKEKNQRIGELEEEVLRLRAKLERQRKIMFKLWDRLRIVSAILDEIKKPF